MHASQTLPERYREAGTLDIARDRNLVIILNIAGLILVALSGWLFFQAIIRFRPDDAARGLSRVTIHNLIDLAGLIFWILLLTVVHVILHEAVHGLFFWIFTGARPRFAFRWTYAYAAAPGWFIPRNAFLVTTLAPLILISLGGLAMVPIFPPAGLLATWYILTMNAGGSVGDLLVAVWILRHTRHCRIQDRGDAVTLYLPENSSPKDKNSLFHF